MLRIFCFVVIALGLFGLPVQDSRAQQNLDFYTVSAIPIDEEGEDLVAAKARGILAAKTQAMRNLLARMTAGDQQVITPSAAEVEAMTLSSSLHQEAFGGDRYRAELIVQFNPRQVQRYLQRFGVSFIDSRAIPARLIPEKRVLGIDQLVLADDPLYRAWDSYLKNSNKDFAFVPFILVDQMNFQDKMGFPENSGIYQARMEFFQPEDSWSIQEALSVRVIVSSARYGNIVPLNRQKRFTLSVKDGIVDWTPAFSWVQKQVDQKWRDYSLSQVGNMNQKTEIELVLISNNQAHTVALRSALEKIQAVDRLLVKEISPQRVLMNVVYQGSETNFNARLSAGGLQIRQSQSEAEQNIAQDRLILDTALGSLWTTSPYSKG